MKNLRPAGVYILIEDLPVEETSTGGIVLQTEEYAKKEQLGRDIGIVKAIGKAAYTGIQRCPGETAIERASQWDYKIGDMVEYRKYDGKVTRLADTDERFKGYRYILDQDIMGVIYDDD